MLLFLLVVSSSSVNAFGVISNSRNRITAGCCATGSIVNILSRFTNSGCRPTSFHETTLVCGGCRGSSCNIYKYHPSLMLSNSNPTMTVGVSSWLQLKMTTTTGDNDNNNSKQSIVLGELKCEAPTAATLDTVSDQIKELKQLLIENSHKSDETLIRIDETFVQIIKILDELKTLPIVAAFINILGFFIVQLTTTNSVRVSEKAIREKVDRVEELFRSTVSITEKYFWGVVVVALFISMISLISYNKVRTMELK